VAGAEVTSENCFPEAGKYYPKPKAESTIFQLREALFTNDRWHQ